MTRANGLKEFGSKVGGFFKKAGKTVLRLFDRFGGALKGSSKGAEKLAGGITEFGGGALQGFANPQQHHVNNNQNNSN